MKKILFPTIAIIIFVELLSSCSHETSESQPEFTNSISKKNRNDIDYSEAKLLAFQYTNAIYTLFDKLEEIDFKNENDAIEFSMSYMQDSNNLFLQRLGLQGTLDYKDFSLDDSINIDDIYKLEITDIEKYYLTNLYNFHLERDDKSLIRLTDDFINDIKEHTELKSLSFYFALIDVNRDLFSSNLLYRSKSNCAKAAIVGGTVSGAIGMVSGAIKGGIYGTVLGMNPGTGAVGAIAGAVGGGLFGFVNGAVVGYLSCKVYG